MRRKLFRILAAVLAAVAVMTAVPAVAAADDGQEEKQ